MPARASVSGVHALPIVPPSERFDPAQDVRAIDVFTAYAQDPDDSRSCAQRSPAGHSSFAIIVSRLTRSGRARKDLLLRSARQLFAREGTILAHHEVDFHALRMSMTLNIVRRRRASRACPDPRRTSPCRCAREMSSADGSGSMTISRSESSAARRGPCSQNEPTIMYGISAASRSALISRSGQRRIVMALEWRVRPHLLEQLVADQ